MFKFILAVLGRRQHPKSHIRIGQLPVCESTSCAIGLSLDSVPLRTRGKEPGRSLELHRRFLESIGDQLDTVPGIHSCKSLRSFDPTAERIESHPFNSCPPAVLQINIPIHFRRETFRRLNLKYPLSIFCRPVIDDSHQLPGYSFSQLNCLVRVVRDNRSCLEFFFSQVYRPTVLATRCATMALQQDHIRS